MSKDRTLSPFNGGWIISYAAAAAATALGRSEFSLLTF